MADVPALANALARAFHDDPVSIWSCKPERPRPRMLERFHATRLRQLLEHEEVWTDESLRVAALWAPPGQWRESPRQDLEIARCLLHPRLIWRLPLLARGFGGMELQHPRSPPHWYLAVLGTDPPAQGQGLGSAALAPVLERCDGDGVGAYLESSKQSNIAFYARHGFKVTREIQLPRGPKLWAMWRDPRG
jgi:GNAT superfamily N-acetyltransferase